MASKTRVLIVDDSALMRNLVSKIISGTDDMEVAATAVNGRFGLDKIEHVSPDVVILDLEMPDVNGVDFLRAQKERGLRVPVIVLSSLAKRGAVVTMEALALGASDFVTKPSVSKSDDIGRMAAQLLGIIRALRQETSAARHAKLPPKDTAVDLRAPASERRRRKPSGKVELVAIGVSTGGPSALRILLRELPSSIGVPIVVVQHMPPGFTSAFANSLDRTCSWEVREAADGDPIQPAHVLVAPGGSHLAVERRSGRPVCRTHQEPPENGHRPSADVLFRSVAKEFGNRAMAVIMTGMGSDGALGIASIFEEGGVTVGQDRESSVVYGMPRVAFENGYLDRQVSLSKLAGDIEATVTRTNSVG